LRRRVCFLLNRRARTRRGPKPADCWLDRPHRFELRRSETKEGIPYLGQWLLACTFHAKYRNVITPHTHTHTCIHNLLGGNTKYKIVMPTFVCTSFYLFIYLLILFVLFKRFADLKATDDCVTHYIAYNIIIVRTQYTYIHPNIILYRVLSAS